jgi:ADP-ribose pyrophosphatase YjhB (NUDIX family)
MTVGKGFYSYCPHCRTVLEDEFVFGRMRRVCPECGFIHFIDPKVGAGVLVELDGKVVLVRRAVVPALGAWCLPSGFVEYDEAPDQAAVRECWEETGLRVSLTGLLDVRQYTNDARGPGIVILYRGQVVGGEPRPGDDASEVGCFGPDDLPDDIAFATHRRVLARWQRELRGDSYSTSNT